MGDLVRGDVVLHEGGRHHETPAEGQIAVGRTTPPAAARVLYGEPPRLHAGMRGLFSDDGCEGAARFRAEEIGHPARQELWAARNMQRVALDPDGPAGARAM